MVFIWEFTVSQGRSTSVGSLQNVCSKGSEPLRLLFAQTYIKCVYLISAYIFVYSDSMHEF